MIKQKSKKNFCSVKLIKVQGDTKKTWHIIKELIGKSGIDKSSFPHKIVIDKTEIVGEIKIANKFNKFSINIGPKLTHKISQPLKHFESYMSKVNSEMENKPITVNELKEAFYSLKLIKVQVMTTLVIMLSKIVSGSCVNHYYIYLIYHLQVEYFETA